MRPKILAVALALALGPASCKLPNDTISGEDDSTFRGAARLSWDLGRAEPATDEPPTRARTYTQVDVELSASSSGFVQHVPSGTAIEVGNTQFVGPRDVAIDFDLQRLTSDLRVGMVQEQGLGVEGFVGLGFSRLDLTGSVATGSSSETLNGLGLLLGMALFYEPTRRVRFYAEASLNPSITDTSDVTTDVTAIELGMSLRLTDHLGLRGGWHQVTYKASNDIFESDLDLKASGPALTLSFSI